jgi:hypothetical protein
MFSSKTLYIWPSLYSLNSTFPAHHSPSIDHSVNRRIWRGVQIFYFIFENTLFYENILLSIAFYGNLCSYFGVKDQVSRSYETRGKSIVLYSKQMNCVFKLFEQLTIQSHLEVQTQCDSINNKICKVKKFDSKKLTNTNSLSLLSADRHIRDKAPKLKPKNVIMCCLIRATAHLEWVGGGGRARLKLLLAGQTSRSST